jgi:predicted Rossmann fold nucleotide-binding protein DprA/Smf involved in DNA uptake
MDGSRQPGLAGCAFDSIFLLASVPRRCYSCGNELALVQAKQRQPVVSGFHSPLEQSVLKVLLQARCPVVVALARPVVGARLPPEWAEPLAQDRMAVVSAAARSGRLTEELAAQRNEWVAALASQIVVAHASPGGRLAALCDGWGYKGQRIRWLG